MQTRAFVKRFTFHEERANTVKRRLALLCAQFVKCFKNGLVKVAGSKPFAFVFGWLKTGFLAQIQIDFVCSFDEFEIFCVYEVKTIP